MNNCINTKKLAILRAFLTEAVGIEPTSMVLETTVLPLNYAPIRSPYRTDKNDYSTDFSDLASTFLIFLYKIIKRSFVKVNSTPFVRDMEFTYS